MNVSASIPRRVFDMITWGHSYVVFASDERVVINIGENEQLYAMSRELYTSLIQGAYFDILTPSIAHVDYDCATCYEKPSEEEILKVDLEAALAREDYKRACEIRDKLKQL